MNVSTYDVFDQPLSVYCESSDFFFHINTYLKSVLRVDMDATPSARLLVFDAPHGRLLMCSPELGLVSECITPTSAYVVYRRMIRMLMALEDRKSYLLHGCCVSNNKMQAIVLVGAAGAGKTSLTGALLQRGLLFACDDYTYITETGHVNVFPVASAISRRTFNLIPELQKMRIPQCRFRAPQGWEWTVFYGDVFPYVPAYTKLSVSHVFFLSPNFGRESSVIDMHNRDVQFRLYEAKHNTPWKYEVEDVSQREREVRAVTSLIKTARFFEARNGNIQDLADIIFGIVNG